MNETATHTARTVSDLPLEVFEVFNQLYTAELTTLGRSGLPISWPILPIFWEKRGVFVVLTSIGLPQKALNLRRNPNTSLLFSDHTGSGLADPPIVLVQGRAQVEEQIFVSRSDADPELLEVILYQAREMIQKQPSMSLYLQNPVTRFLMDWYFMRLLITIKPRNILWWRNGDYAQTPQATEVTYVV